MKCLSDLVQGSIMLRNERLKVFQKICEVMEINKLERRHYIRNQTAWWSDPIGTRMSTFQKLWMHISRTGTYTFPST